MPPTLTLRKTAILLAAIALLAVAVVPLSLDAFSFMPDRQVSQRLLFPIADSPFPVAAGDTIADRELGQMDFAHGTQNFADASTLDLSRVAGGVAIDQSSVPNRVYVSDSANNRVLGWASATALTNGKPADMVIGQPDFFSTTCSNGGVSASSLCVPLGIAVDGSGNLYVADSRNSRVLEYNTPFTNTGQPGSGDGVADQVFGQGGSFSASACNQGAGTVANANTLCRPAAVAIDATGVLYVADQGNNRVLEYLFPSISITASDVFGQNGQFSTTVCNKGGVSADSLCGPGGLASDGSFNNLYVADTNNSRVLEFNNPVANDTTADAVFGQGNNFTTTQCNEGAAAPSASTLCGPQSVTIDLAGHLFVADRSNSRVLLFTTFPAVSTTASKVFGQGGSFIANACNLSSGVPSATGLCRPGAVALDAPGNLYVADDQNNRVLRYNSAVSGDTTADVALGQPDLAHNDRNAVDASGFGGDGADVILAGSLDIAALGAVAIDNSVSPARIWVADTHNNRVLGFSNAAAFANGAPASIVIGQQNFTGGFSVACNGSPTASTLCSPTGVAVDAQGNLYVADELDNRVLKFLAPVTTGKAASLVIGQADFVSSKCNAGGANPTAATLCSPWTLTLDAVGNLYVADLTNNRVLEYSKPASSHPNAAHVFGQSGFTGGNCNQNNPPTASSLCEPTSAALDSSGRLYIADFSNSRILRYNTPLISQVANLEIGQGNTGTNFTSNSCNGGGIGSATLCNAAGVAVEPSGGVYVADSGNNRILHFSLGSVIADLVFGQGGFFITQNANLGGTTPSAATLSLPLWLGVDTPGNLYAADAGNNRVLQYEAPLGGPNPTPTPGMATLSTSPPTNPPSIVFGNVATGDTSPFHKVTLTNNGTGTIVINAVTRVGSNPTDFPQNNNCIGSLAGGKSCTINVAFSPTAQTGQSEAAQILVYDNAKNSPQLLPIFGNSAVQATLAPSSLTFGNVAVASTSPAKFLKLTNNRSSPLTISAISLGGTNTADFPKSTTCGASLAAFASCTIQVQFKPVAQGARSAIVKVTDNASNSPQSASVAGTGVTQVTVSPSALMFGSVSVGSTTAAMTVTVTNNQSVTLNISTITLGGVEPADFLKSTTCTATLAPFSNCTVSVKFKPTATGSRTATLSITDNPDSGPHSVGLSGTGL